jgi:hypothetical protein
MTFDANRVCSAALVPAAERLVTLVVDGSKRYFPHATKVYPTSSDGRTACIRASIQVTPLMSALWFDELTVRAQELRSERYRGGFEDCSLRTFRWKGKALTEAQFDHYDLAEVLKDVGDWTRGTNDARQHEASARQGHYLCMQPGCTADASAFYRLRNGHVLTRNEGLVQLDRDRWTVQETTEHVRWFCEAHAQRGERDLDDSMRNYDVLAAPPYMGGDVVLLTATPST